MIQEKLLENHNIKLNVTTLQRILVLEKNKTYEYNGYNAATLKEVNINDLINKDNIYALEIITTNSESTAYIPRGAKCILFRGDTSNYDFSLYYNGFITYGIFEDNDLDEYFELLEEN